MNLLKGYQREGLRWMQKREESDIEGGFLCDEMGLGKTIMLLALVHSNPLPKTLVVVPKTIVSQWISETRKFFPGVSVSSFDGPGRTLKETQLVICPYSVLGDLIEFKWDRVILDEAHEIRNPNSKVHAYAQCLDAKKKWVVTGTPVFNSVRDFVSLGNFLGIPQRFIQRDDAVSKYVLRRTRTDLPRVEFENVELTMSHQEQTLYNMVYDDFKDIMSSEGSSEFAILEGLLRCRQVCVLPQLYYDGISSKDNLEREEWIGSTVKLDYLLNAVKSHPGEKTLVFTHFIGETIAIQRMFNESRIRAFRLDGETVNREAEIENFKKSPEGSAFIIQIKSGGVGLNLQEASRIYITHPAWNPATELQAIARAQRTGQKRQVRVQKLVYVCDNSIEQEIIALQIAKSKLSAGLLKEPELALKIPACSSPHVFALKLGKKIRDPE
jgi:SNF2 family DNA or RNA helicase